MVLEMIKLPFIDAVIKECGMDKKDPVCVFISVALVNDRVVV